MREIPNSKLGFLIRVENPYYQLQKSPTLILESLIRNPKIPNPKIKIFPILEISNPKLKSLIRNGKLSNPKLEISN